MFTDQGARRAWLIQVQAHIYSRFTEYGAEEGASDVSTSNNLALPFLWHHGSQRTNEMWSRGPDHKADCDCEQPSRNDGNSKFLKIIEPPGSDVSWH